MGDIITVNTKVDKKKGASSSNSNPCWQLGIKSIADKWNYIFENQLYTDIQLVVGENLEIVECHKVLLILHSPVFESMLSSRWSTIGNTAGASNLETTSSSLREELQLPEDDPTLIKLLISCFYNGNPTTVDSALDLLLIAKKYICPHVITKCLQYLKTSTNEKNVIQIFQIACLADELELIKQAESFILSKACHLVRLEEFSKLSLEHLQYFLCHDDLNVDEVDLFNAVYKWGQLECRKLELDENKSENISKVLKEIFPLIRFPCMSLEDFSVHVVSKNVLPLEQTVEVYKFLTTPPVKLNKESEQTPENIIEEINSKEESSTTNLKFNTSKRSRKLFSYIFKRLKGYGYNFGRQWQNFCFQVDHDIKLLSLGFYRAIKPDVEIIVSVKILDDEMNQIFSEVEETTTCSLDQDVFHVSFPTPVRISKNIFYTISYMIQGEETLYKYGEPLQVQLSCSSDLKISFWFKGAISDTDMDQVPEFCFQL